MRVPICISDLQEGQGFTRLTEALQREWPGADPLSLTDARHALSRGLGYRDFNDLQQSAHNALACEPLTDQAEARDGISTALFVCWQAGNAEEMDESNLHRLVMSLPLQGLIAFGASPAHPPSNQPDPSAPALADVIRDDCWDCSGLAAEAPVLDEAGIRRIWETVKSKGHLRDLCLFMLLMTGHRMNAIRLVRFCDISKLDSGTLVKLTTDKVTSQESFAFLPHRFMDMVTQYKRQANLSEDDHLFHSRADASVPMRSGVLNRLALKYLDVAVPNPALRSVYLFRRSVLFNQMKSGLLPLADFYEYMAQHRNSGSFTLRKK
ncbi:hypothetical protein [Pseudomonas sp. NFR16]|uniref:hypothetical protein n=1 Tax=Pseudomonas sp. NFR16 TaxID=1566248 RepID=UPI0008AAE504|nr:hypothetical protein [Pseudomonas sp. NFR16]SEJ94503.1 hypothetical protein SAMN03159495_5407 [Pseudomonas sp. NFR16]